MEETTADLELRESAGEQELAQAAQTLGIETEYWDVWGKRHPASRATESAILRSLGVDTRGNGALQDSLARRAWEEWSRPLPPTSVLIENGAARHLAISLPEALANREAALEIRWETGDSARLEVRLSEIAEAQEAQFQGCRFVRKHLPLPDRLPLGYHQAVLHIAGEAPAPGCLIVCPPCAYQPEWLREGRASGIAISLYGLRSERNWGCGDTTDLNAFIDWVAAQTGASFIALNPLHAIANRQPFNTSPYLPNSVFYRNPIYLDPEQIEDFQNCPRAAALLQSPAIQKELAALRSSDLVEYERVYRLKLRFLKLLFRTFLREWSAGTPRARELRAYIEAEGELLRRMAIHSALDESIHKQRPEVWNWPAWPEEYQEPESPATRDFAQRHWRSVLFHQYLQWQLDRQLQAAQARARERGLKIGLYHDLALATDRFGADLWAHREFFIAGCRVGAPPDDFSPKGQDWAFPPPNSLQHYRDGYRLFRESLRKNCRHGGALRIDHVMRFFRLYWIPDGMEATEGTYVRDRYQELLAILALESVRNEVVVIGEDLGTVPDEVREALHRFGILSYRLFYFERGRDGRFRAPAEYPREALASVTTHDLPTLAGFWRGRDIEARRDAGLLHDQAAFHAMLQDRSREKQRMLDLLHELRLLPEWFARNAADVPELTGELHNAVVGFLASTPSALMLLNQEDLLKETEQQNLPGSTAEYPNWRRKMKCRVEDLWKSQEVKNFVQMFRSWMERTGRS